LVLSPSGIENLSPIYSGKEEEIVADYLAHRRSCPLKNMGKDGPSNEQTLEILRLAARVPDHGKLFPWYFIVLSGDDRITAGAHAAKAWAHENPDQAEPAKLELEAEKFTRAPTIIAVVSRIRDGKAPQWEQILSAGALCQNLCLAANAKGFGTNWLTEWYSFSPKFKELMGLDERDHFAGFIYIGNVETIPEERPRPDLEEIINWGADAPLKKGDAYNQDKFGIPKAGFELVKL
jgi:nitroreductase